MQNDFQSNVSRLLEEAKQSAQHGEREKAYQISLRATTVAPEDPLAWYVRSRNAPSPEEQLMCLSRAYSLDPKFPDTKIQLRTAIQNLLKQEPFLAYVHETEEFYQVRSGRELLINIPKNRTFEIPYLKKKPGLAQPAFRWLSLSILALFLGGVGAVVCAPVAAFQALRLHASTPSEGERIRLVIVFLLAVIIWLAAIPISWLLLIRFFPP
jgi:hypothetical protein